MMIRRNKMIRTKALSVALGIVVLLATVAIACGNGDDSDEPAANTSPAGTAEQISSVTGGPSPTEVVLMRATGNGTAQSGIWVTGQSTVTLEPDLALLNVGVETFAPTVATCSRRVMWSNRARRPSSPSYGCENLEVVVFQYKSCADYRIHTPA